MSVAIVLVFGEGQFHISHVVVFDVLDLGQVELWVILFNATVSQYRQKNMVYIK